MKKSFIQSIKFDFWTMIMDDPFIPSWRRDDGNIVIKTKSKYTKDDHERLKKNFRVLYILQCALDTT